MDKFTALGFARAYDVYADAPGIVWRRTQGGVRRDHERLWDAALAMSATVRTLGWGDVLVRL